MRKEAELFGDEDAQRRELVELKNGAETIFYQYENILRDNSESITALAAAGWISAIFDSSNASAASRLAGSSVQARPLR